MSAISSVSGSGLTLQQLIAQITQQQQTQQSGQNPSSSQSTSTDGTSEAQRPHHHHGGGGMFKKIESAVTNALQSANGSTDPNKAIEDAIAQVFQGNTTTSGQSASTDPNSVTQANSTTQASASSGPQAFMQFLQDHGVSADQFRQDFMAAIQDANNGQPNAATAFQSFPPGTVVNMTA